MDGVTKLKQLPTGVDGMHGGKPRDREAEYLRKTFLAMGSDFRVMLIKLADRLHNMRTLGYMPAHKQLTTARETLDIFAPIANRLGIWQMKWELEDLAFRYIDPDRYKEIANQIDERRKDREAYMERVTATSASSSRGRLRAEFRRGPAHLLHLPQDGARACPSARSTTSGDPHHRGLHPRASQALGIIHLHLPRATGRV